VTGERKAPHSWLWYLVVLTVGFVATYLLSTLLQDRRSGAYSTFAALLQFLGVLTVAKGISDLRAEIGLPSFWTELGRELRERWNKLLGRHDAQNIVANVAVSFSFAGNATVKVGLPPNATTDQRFQHLQDQIDGLTQVDRNLDKRINDEAKEKTDAISALKAETERKQQELWDRVAAIQTGGIRLETVGLVWVAAGSILPAFPSLAHILWTLAA
jgi:hypothetical protein